MSDDYGYFGHGDEGYAHYTAETGDDKFGKGGGGNKGGKRGGNIGCLVVLFIFLLIYIISYND